MDTNRPFQFHKGRQHFIGVHNEPLSIVAMRVEYAASIGRVSLVIPCIF